MEQNFIQTNNNSRLWKFALSAALVVLLLAAGGTAMYFYKKYSAIKNTPGQAAVADTQATVDAVAKLFVLPTNEQPTVATVTDPTKLGNQNFFAQAKVGDKVLLYAQAKLAILYDPSVNKIVSVAPIDLSDQNAPATSGTTTTK